MKKPRVAAASSAGLLGLVLVATPANAEITSVTLSSTEPGTDIGMTVTGTECLPEAGDVVRVRVAPVDGDDFVNGVVGIPDAEGNWEAVGSVDILEAGDYDVRAFCHFEGTDPAPTDLIGTAQITLSEDEPPGTTIPGTTIPGTTIPPDDELPPGGPSEDPPGGPGDSGGEPEPGDNGDDGTDDGTDDDGDDGADDSTDDGDDDGDDDQTPAAPAAQPAEAPPAVNGEPEFTG